MPAKLYYGGKLIEGATAGVREALPFMHQLVEMALPANEIIRRLTAAGQTIRRQSALNVIRQLKDIKTSGEYVKAVPNKFIPNPDRIHFAATDIRRNYSYKVRVEGTDTHTGEKKSFFVQVTSDNLISKNAAYDIVQGYLADNAQNYAFEFASAVAVELVKSPRLAAAS